MKGILGSKSHEKKEFGPKREKNAFARKLTRVWGVPPANTVHIQSYTVRNLKYGTGYTAYRGYGVYTVIRFGPTLDISLSPCSSSPSSVRQYEPGLAQHANRHVHGTPANFSCVLQCSQTFTLILPFKAL